MAPVHPKKKISLLFLVDFVAIMIAYIILAYSAVFAYGAEEIPSAYTTFFKEQDKSILFKKKEELTSFGSPTLCK